MLLSSLGEVNADVESSDSGGSGFVTNNRMRLGCTGETFDSQIGSICVLAGASPAECSFTESEDLPFSNWADLSFSDSEDLFSDPEGPDSSTRVGDVVESRAERSLLRTCRTC